MQPVASTRPGRTNAGDEESVGASTAPWAASVEDVAGELHVDVEGGLSDDVAARRRQKYGANDLRRRKPRSSLSILVDQFHSLIVALLVVAGGVAFLFGEILEAWAIAAVIVINTALGFFTELRAVRSMEALYALSRVTARVRRGGRVHEIDAGELVPGDIVILEAGDLVAADMRLTVSSRLQVDESTLTGESLPVGKSVEPVSVETALADRSCMLYKGTSVTRGSGQAVVTETGIRTELGRIAELVAETADDRTPLEERLDKLGRKLIWVTLGIAVIVTLTGLARGKDLFLMIETGIALAVASIPEGLPIVATIALARGVRLMARRNALVNRLSSVETLGSAGVICTDKTGTLTENRMTVVRLITADEDVTPGDERIDETPSAVRAVLETGMLCNNATWTSEDKVTGDPLEVALLAAGAQAGLDRSNLLEACKRVDEEAFDSVVKMMATVHDCGDRYRYAVKGAPEAVIDACAQERRVAGDEQLDESRRQAWRERNELLASEGLRVVGVAEKYAADADADRYGGLVLLGLIGMADPPRTDVRSALDTCRQAGIQVVMVTGDQPVTALSVARAVGLVEEGDREVVHGADLPAIDEMTEEEQARLRSVTIFARVNPSQKLDLIDLHQRAGHVVAMTGDGINDAPALQMADIGIAMGQRGTQVAREAADMVLRDDAFSSIVAAVEQGRVIFGNIRRFVFYLLSCNVSEVMVVTLATILGGPLPILPLQILFLNLVTDVFPAMALGMGAGDPSVMQQRPRDPADPILKRRHWVAIAVYGGLITASVLGALFVAYVMMHRPVGEAVTISFLTLAFAQLVHVFNMRSRGSSIWNNEIVTNPFVWGAVLLCTGLLLGAIYVPGVAAVMQIHPPDFAGWMIILAFSAVPLVVGQVILLTARGSRRTA